MENYQDNWQKCLAMIREKYGDKFRHWFDVWFGDVRFESYEQATHTLLVQVPSKYVYEYLEMNGANDLRWATHEAFGCDVALRYRIARSQPAFSEVAEYLQHHGYDSRKDPFHIAIPDARKRMEDGLHYYLNGSERWLPGYDRVADWLTDNNGRGLLCVGTPGLGKSLLCQKILPVILGNGGRPIVSVNAGELHSRVEELKKERILIIDDLGKEKRRHFGDIDNSFFELCNNAERNGNLLIITTNLSTKPIAPGRPSAALYPDSIEHRYGSEVLDRLKAITSVTVFQGDSMRR